MRPSAPVKAASGAAGKAGSSSTAKRATGKAASSAKAVSKAKAAIRKTPAKRTSDNKRSASSSKQTGDNKKSASSAKKADKEQKEKASSSKRNSSKKTAAETKTAETKNAAKATSSAIIVVEVHEVEETVEKTNDPVTTSSVESTKEAGTRQSVGEPSGSGAEKELIGEKEMIPLVEKATTPALARQTTPGNCHILQSGQPVMPPSSNPSTKTKRNSLPPKLSNSVASASKNVSSLTSVNSNSGNEKDLIPNSVGSGDTIAPKTDYVPLCTPIQPQKRRKEQLKQRMTPDDVDVKINKLEGEAFERRRDLRKHGDVREGVGNLSEKEKITLPQGASCGPTLLRSDPPKSNGSMLMRSGSMFLQMSTDSEALMAPSRQKSYSLPCKPSFQKTPCQKEFGEGADNTRSRQFSNGDAIMEAASERKSMLSMSRLPPISHIQVSLSSASRQSNFSNGNVAGNPPGDASMLDGSQHDEMIFRKNLKRMVSDASDVPEALKRVEDDLFFKAGHPDPATDPFYDGMQDDGYDGLPTGHTVSLQGRSTEGQYTEVEGCAMAVQECRPKTSSSKKTAISIGERDESASSSSKMPTSGAASSPSNQRASAVSSSSVSVMSGFPLPLQNQAKYDPVPLQNQVKQIQQLSKKADQLEKKHQGLKKEIDVPRTPVLKKSYETIYKGKTPFPADLREKAVKAAEEFNRHLDEKKGKKDWRPNDRDYPKDVFLEKTFLTLRDLELMSRCNLLAYSFPKDPAKGRVYFNPQPRAKKRFSV